VVPLHDLRREDALAVRTLTSSLETEKPCGSATLPRSYFPFPARALVLGMIDRGSTRSAVALMAVSAGAVLVELRIGLQLVASGAALHV
jgi:hypothetical protein